MKQIIKIILFSIITLSINAQNISIKQIRKAPDSLMIILSDGTDENHFSYQYISNYSGKVDSVYVRNDSVCSSLTTGEEYCYAIAGNQTLSFAPVTHELTISNGNTVNIADNNYWSKNNPYNVVFLQDENTKVQIGENTPGAATYKLNVFGTTYTSKNIIVGEDAHLYRDLVLWQIPTINNSVDSVLIWNKDNHRVEMRDINTIGSDDQQITNFSFNPGTHILTITLEDGNTKTVDLSALIDDADADPTNEYNTSVQLNGNNLEVTDGGGTKAADISALYDNTDDQQISIDSVTSPKRVFTITLEDGGQVKFEDQVGTPGSAQTLSTDNTPGNISISGGNTITLNVNDDDADATNEIQTITLDSTSYPNLRTYTLYLSDGGDVTWVDSVGSGGGSSIVYVDTIYRKQDSICYKKNTLEYCVIADTSLWVTDASGIHSKSYRHVGIGEDANSSAILTVQGRADWNDGGLSVFIGDAAGRYDDLSNNRNVGIGYYTLSSNTTGSYNMGVGFQALHKNKTGNSNLAIGYKALILNVSGVSNTSLGYFSGGNIVNGSYNTFIGSNSGYNCTGSFNTFIGYNSGINETGSNKLYIDNSSTSNPLIYGKFDTDTLRINGSLQIRDVATDNTLENILVQDATNQEVKTRALSTINTDDADADPNNEIQSLSIANNNIAISNGNTITVPDTNSVLNQDSILITYSDGIEINRDTIRVASTGGSAPQTLATTGAAGNISISDGNTINVNVNDADSDPTNETETATNTGAFGGEVYYQKIGNEFQFRKLYSSDASINVGNNGDRVNITKVPFTVNTWDDSHSFQVPDINGNTMTFDGIGDISVTTPSDGSHVVQIAYIGSTAAQTLSFANPNLSISGGNTVDISAINTDNQGLAEFSISTGESGGLISIRHDNNATTQTIDIEETVEDLIGDNVRGGTDISTSYDDATGHTTINFTGSAGSSYWNANGSDIYNNNTGYVGINTNLPDQRFHVYGTGATRIKIEGGGSGYIQSGLLFETSNSIRGAGSFSHNSATGKTWFWGQPYNSSDAFSIGRYTGGGTDAASNITNSLLKIDNTGLATHYGDVTIENSTPKLTFNRDDSYDWNINNATGSTLNIHNQNTTGILKIDGGNADAKFEYNTNNSDLTVTEINGYKTLELLSNHRLKLYPYSSTPAFEFDASNQILKLGNTSGGNGDVVAATDVNGTTEWKSTRNFARAYNTATQVISTSGNYTKIEFDTEEFEEGAVNVDAVNDLINLTEAGYYRIEYKAVVTMGSTGFLTEIRLKRGSAQINNTICAQDVDANYTTTLQYSTIVHNTGSNNYSVDIKTAAGAEVTRFTISASKIHL